MYNVLKIAFRQNLQPKLKIFASIEAAYKVAFSKNPVLEINKKV